MVTRSDTASQPLVARGTPPDGWRV
jgi:hypothetical protein